jgi:hypothetical protein
MTWSPDRFHLSPMPRVAFLARLAERSGTKGLPASRQSSFTQVRAVADAIDRHAARCGLHDLSSPGDRRQRHHHGMLRLGNHCPESVKRHHPLAKRRQGGPATVTLSRSKALPGIEVDAKHEARAHSEIPRGGTHGLESVEAEVVCYLSLYSVNFPSIISGMIASLPFSMNSRSALPWFKSSN